MILSSTLLEAFPKYESSTAKVLLFPGDSGVAVWERVFFAGLPKAGGAIFMAFSKAVGRSFAPGGFRFLLGLP